MAEREDLEKLAARYLDLWQEQASALAGDPEVAATLRSLFVGGPDARRLGDAMAAWGAVLPPALLASGMLAAGRQEAESQGAGNDETANGESTKRGRRRLPAGDAHGPEAAAVAPRHGGLDLDELARRLAALERRIADLEAGAAGRGRGAQGKSRKHRS